jgi:hypothetical protein
MLKPFSLRSCMRLVFELLAADDGKRGRSNDFAVGFEARH